MIIELNFTTKPSIVTIKSNIRKAVAQGGTFIIIRYGENQINIEQSQWGWIGRGWIGRNGGQDIANEMNKP